MGHDFFLSPSTSSFSKYIQSTSRCRFQLLHGAPIPTALARLHHLGVPPCHSPSKRLKWKAPSNLTMLLSQLKKLQKEPRPGQQGSSPCDSIMIVPRQQ